MATTGQKRRTRTHRRGLTLSRRRKIPAAPELIIERLSPLYGPVEWQPRMNGLDELVFTVLTQHTSDLNAERAYREMRRRYPSWQAVADAPTDALTDAIRSGGLANQKSIRIQQILREIGERTGSFSLDLLRDMPLDEARAWLKSLPGVGPKTASVVLAFAFGMPAMPVDTHIHRVARRLGLISRKTNADAAHDILEAIVKPENRYKFHVLLITHGRRICKARRPLCLSCPLNNVCPTGRKLLGGDPTSKRPRSSSTRVVNH